MFRTVRARLAVAVIASLAGLAYGDTIDDLIVMTVQQRGKFLSELPDLPKVVVLSAVPVDNAARRARYDQVKGVMVIDTPVSFIGPMYFETRCEGAGTYAGKTASGKTRRVSRVLCTSLHIEDTEQYPYPSFGDAVEMAMSPTEYREAKAQGLRYTLQFDVGAGATQEVFEAREEESKKPTLSDPVETLNAALTARGRVLSIVLSLPKSRRELVTLQRQQQRP